MKPALALPHVAETVYYLDDKVLQEGRLASRGSARRRMALPIHRKLSDGVQRLINFLQPGSYIAPHHHPAEGFSESILVLEGRLLFLEFSATGEVLQTRILVGGTPQCLVDFIGPVIHAFVCLQADTVVLEIKKGPYLAEGDKVFAPWAPAEGSPEAKGYLAGLEVLAG